MVSPSTGRSARAGGAGFDDEERGVRVMRGASRGKFDGQRLGAEPRRVKNARSNLRVPFVLVSTSAIGLPSSATMGVHMSKANRSGRWTGVVRGEGREDVGHS